MTARDPGAAGERTFLAWHRSGLTTFVVAAVLLRAGEWGPAALAAAVGGAFELVAVGRLRSLHDDGVLPPPLSPSSMRLVTAAVVAVGVGAALSL